MTTSPAVQSEGLKVRRGRKPVLAELNFRIAAGSITGLFGPSGCGKTTLMRAITGLQHHEGKLQVLGVPAGHACLRGRIGYVTQSPSLYPELSVDENLAYFARLAGGEVAGVVEKLGLTDVRGQRVSALSGGQRGRASLGAALVGEPELLVMDEPTVGLDPVVRARLWDSFRELAQGGRTLLISSHVMEEAGRCDRLLLMREGRLIWQGTPAELLEGTGAGSYEDAFLATIEKGRQ